LRKQQQKSPGTSGGRGSHVWDWWSGGGSNP
jgi:hypothetical protein